MTVSSLRFPKGLPASLLPNQAGFMVGVPGLSEHRSGESLSSCLCIICRSRWLFLWSPIPVGAGRAMHLRAGFWHMLYAWKKRSKSEARRMAEAPFGPWRDKANFNKILSKVVQLLFAWVKECASHAPLALRYWILLLLFQKQHLVMPSRTSAGGMGSSQLRNENVSRRVERIVSLF